LEFPRTGKDEIEVANLSVEKKTGGGGAFKKEVFRSSEVPKRNVRRGRNKKGPKTAAINDGEFGEGGKKLEDIKTKWGRLRSDSKWV